MRFIILFSLFFISAHSFAESYQWRANSFDTRPFPSPSASCDAVVAARQVDRNPAYGTSTGEVSKTTAVQYLCTLYWTPVGGSIGWDTQTNIVRSGTTCSDGQPADPDTGLCPELDQCQEKAGDSSPYNKSGNIDDGYVSVVDISGKKYHVSPNDACMGGCSVAVQSNCIATISTNRYRCSGTAYYTGTSCTASTETPQVEQQENYVPDEPKNIEIKEPCIYTQDAEGKSVCVSKASLEKEGQHCGEYNGKEYCVPKQATTDEKTVQTEVTETTEPDGGKKIVKKDVATVTKCTASKQNCTTTTTTTTTTSKSDGTGATTSTTVECKGKDCGSGVGGGGAGSGSNDGEDEEDVPGELEGQDEVAGFGESLQDFNTRISGAPILSTVSSISMPRGGSCSMGSASVPLLGSISFNWVCQNASLLDPLYYVMLAMWAIAAVRVFLEA